MITKVHSRTKHGMAGTPEYEIWCGIIKRCYNSRTINYNKYGGRGITVCERWRNNYPNFYKDMGSRPTSEHSIDRINNDGNYEPGNCRWANHFQQAQNKGMRKDNKTGVTGVHWSKLHKSYVANISRGGKRILLGLHKNIDDAITARKKAENEYSDT